ncbi:hypothetical protein LMG33818_000457 [Halomonadaceae bacterium LMG 33818]|uniref:copper resistance D family protein n=1 Tax=Cernens ardua TaxID=3402176 RepID=UPI003EDBB24A
MVAMTALLPDIPSVWVLDVLLPLTHTLFIGGLAWVVGCAVLTKWCMPVSSDGIFVRRILGRWRAAGLIFSLFFGLLWWPFISVEMTGAPSFQHAIPMMNIVLWHTHFGSELRHCLVLLLLALGCESLLGVHRFSCIHNGLRNFQIVLLALVLILQPLIGHGTLVSIGVLLLLELHVMAACVWLGCLPGLFLICYRFPLLAQVSLGRFSRLGVGCVLIVAVTGVVQSLSMVGSWNGIYLTRYGQYVLLKCLLFALMLLLAALNRFHWTPKAKQQPTGIFITLGIETGVGGFLLFIAALLSSQAPPGLMS